jgi:glycosyltransferase involved in cell wall biosynthesis
MKLLFITRKYPPSVGGMENLSYHLAREFKKTPDFKLISWGGSQIWLPFFAIYAFFKASWLIVTRQVNQVHLGDGVLAPVGLAIRTILHTKTTITACGLDITYKLGFYQWLWPKMISKLDKVICISSATLDECVKRGIPKNKCVFIPCGVDPNDFAINATRKDLEKVAGINMNGKKVLVTVGRLVKRKGVAWFIANVLPNLEDDYIYLVAGDGPEKDKIQEIIKSNELQKRVKLLGKISSLDLKILYNTADVFVMPNIPVEGDMEGFGIVAIEASSVGLPVVATNLEGIRDAVIAGKSGYLIDSDSIPSWLKTIKYADSLQKESITKIIKNEFSWKNIGMMYTSEMS